MESVSKKYMHKIRAYCLLVQELATGSGIEGHVTDVQPYA